MEIWDLYDRDRNLLGETVNRGDRIEQGKYHLVVEVWTISKNGTILLTKRHKDKPFGLLWEGTGGSTYTGEESKAGALRELEEETGLSPSLEEEFYFIGTLLRKHSIVDTYLYVHDTDLNELKLQPDEVVDAKLVSLCQFEKMNEEGLIVPAAWERFTLNREKLKAFICFS